jgi:hypothetical protein
MVAAQLDEQQQADQSASITSTTAAASDASTGKAAAEGAPPQPREAGQLVAAEERGTGAVSLEVGFESRLGCESIS